jgi:hypothetical protein
MPSEYRLAATRDCSCARSWALRQLLTAAQAALSLIGKDGRRKLCIGEKKEYEMRQRGSEITGLSPEQLQLRLSLLALERQRLRETRSPAGLLESNRLEIGCCQYELSRALIRRHLERPVERAA